MIQSIPIFDETKLFSIPLPKAVGTSISFSYVLHIYLVLMFLGKSPDKTLTIYIFEQICSNVSILVLILIFWFPAPSLGLFINFRHLYKQRKRRFCTKRKANWAKIFLRQLCCLLISGWNVLNDHGPCSCQINSSFSYKVFPQPVCSHWNNYICGQNGHLTDDAIFRHYIDVSFTGDWFLLRCKF